MFDTCISGLKTVNTHIKKRGGGIRHICFDIDGTLATHRLGYHPVGYFEIVLAGLLCGRGVLPTAALERVLEAEAAYPDADPFRAAGALDIDLKTYRIELAAYQENYLECHEDALRFLTFLRERRTAVYITTNNTRSRAVTVLDFLGLAEQIAGIYTPEEMGARKNQIGFWRGVIRGIGAEPCEMAAVGDEELSDSVVPLQAGFALTCLIPKDRRKLDPSWMIDQFSNVF
jgi:FMN phosphatase YigB (HAD superfamily)